MQGKVSQTFKFAILKKYIYCGCYTQKLCGQYHDELSSLGCFKLLTKIFKMSPTLLPCVFTSSSNCIDVHFRGNKTVAVKDGACSLFDTTKPIEGLSPTAGLKVHC